MKSIKSYLTESRTDTLTSRTNKLHSIAIQRLVKKAGIKEYTIKSKLGDLIEPFNVILENLEKSGIDGFSNFDVKLNPKNNTIKIHSTDHYKLFEFNSTYNKKNYDMFLYYLRLIGTNLEENVYKDTNGIKEIDFRLSDENQQNKEYDKYFGDHDRKLKKQKEEAEKQEEAKLSKIKDTDIKYLISKLKSQPAKFGRYHEIKFGYGVDELNNNWNGQITGLYTYNGKLFADVYWQSNSTDGDDTIEINKNALRNGIVLNNNEYHGAVEFSDKIVKRALLMAIEKLK